MRKQVYAFVNTFIEGELDVKMDKNGTVTVQMGTPFDEVTLFLRGQSPKQLLEALQEVYARQVELSA